MKYIYYPGCSLEGTASEYSASTQAAMQALGSELLELEDWTCCGASAAESNSYLLSIVLGARNLAMAEGMDAKGDILIPCSACYLNLARVGEHVKRDPELLDKINEVLTVEGLTYKGGIKARHFLDVINTDFKPKDIEALVKKKLSGMRVAPYYGCQALRPYCSYDDPEEPRSMEPVIKALGAEIHPWSMGPKCCGAALMSTKKEVALERVGGILAAAKGADCIVTVCPMCQINLEGYQAKVSKMRDDALDISILYLPQLIGLALGLSEDDLKLNLNLAYTDSFKTKLKI
jgi:heterodisulfide reductase subunit B